jgi:hypothetical protein
MSVPRRADTETSAIEARTSSGYLAVAHLTDYQRAFGGVD